MFNICFCRECGDYFIEYENGDIKELDRMPTALEDENSLEICCADHE